MVKIAPKNAASKFSGRIGKLSARLWMRQAGVNALEM
jgi:hypothetical protein